MSLWRDHPSKWPERLRNLPGRESDREIYGLWTDTTEQAPALERFPPDFMFQLTKEEVSIDRSHFVTASAETFLQHIRGKTIIYVRLGPPLKGAETYILT